MNRIYKFGVIGIISTIIMSCIFIMNMNNSAHAQDVRYKYYKSIEVSADDTLWSIAREYCSDEYDDYKEYISEVKKINRIGEQINVGSYLIVPYYSSEEIR